MNKKYMNRFERYIYFRGWTVIKKLFSKSHCKSSSNLGNTGDQCKEWAWKCKHSIRVHPEQSLYNLLSSPINDQFQSFTVWVRTQF